MEKKYSEEIFNEIQKIEREQENIKNTELSEEIKIKKIAIKLNNNKFEQYEEMITRLNEKIKEINKKIDENKIKTEKIKRNKIKQKILEYVYDIGIPIEAENIINDIIKKYKEENLDPTEILRIIINDNIKSYTNIYKKEKLLTQEKMNELKIDKNDQETIKEIKELIGKTPNIQGNIKMTDYLLKLNDELLIETLEKDISFNEQLMINILYSLLEKINQKSEIEKSLELLNLIYETYSDKEEKQTDEKPEKKLIFLRKPTIEESYIFDDLEKIESKQYLKLIKKEFKKLTKGETRGKSLTGLPENLFEKKAMKTRITFKILPNDYILILNCYIKGNKFTQNIREFIEKNNIKYQIHLYDALATENKEIIEQTISKEKYISKQEQENYIKNFIDWEKINIIDSIEEGEKDARKNK